MLRKKEKKEVIVAVSNKKGGIELKKEKMEFDQKALIDQINDPKFKEAVIKATSDSDTEEREPTKFILLGDLSDRNKVDYFTQWKDAKETELPNRLQTWSRLFPVVFGKSDAVTLCQDIVNEHVKDAMVNRTSIKRGRESALVYAVKLDTGLAQTDNQIKTFLRK